MLALAKSPLVGVRTAFTASGPWIRGFQRHVAVREPRDAETIPPPVVALALHPAMTRPFSKNRTVPVVDVVAVIVRLNPFMGAAEKRKEMVGVPTPTVIVMDFVAVAPRSSVAVMISL